VGLSRRQIVKLAGAAVAGPAFARLARAQAPQAALKLHHFFSPLSSIHAKFLVPWAKKVAADSGGRIRIDVFAAMQLGGTPSDLYDQARDGVADIVFTLPGMTPGRFPAIEAFELPFVAGRSALVNSGAAQEFAAAHSREEFRAVQPLCVCAQDRALIHASRPIARLEDLKDLKLRAPTRLAGEALAALGASPVSIPLPQVPAAFVNKLLDGCLLPWDAAAAIKLQEIVKFHSEVPSSPTLATSTFVLAMNRPAYAALAPDLKKVIDDNSGAPAAAMAGRVFDEQSQAAESLVRKRGNTIGAIPAEEAARWRKATNKVIDAWVAALKLRSLDGAKLLETARALVAKYEAQAAAAPPPGPPSCAQWCPSP